MNPIEAHQHFSAECFNQTWSLLDLPERTADQTREVIALAHASLYHWLRREDCTPQNLSIGLWQIARVYAVSDSPLESMRFARDCLGVSESNELSPFSMAYAHEAVSRAALISDDAALAKTHLDRAVGFSLEVSDPQDKVLIDADLAELKRMLS